MSKKLLELFSGTHSIGKVAQTLDYDVYSVDKYMGPKCPFGTNYCSSKHFKEDIMTWNYKQFPPGFFHVITASPVCRLWSKLRHTWVGRTLKGSSKPLTLEDIQHDINVHAKPQIDRLLQIMSYFKPVWWCIENPSSSKLKQYLPMTKLPFVEVDYCKYSNWGYRKRTRLWTNIKFKPKMCHNDCENLINTGKQIVHKNYLGCGRTVVLILNGKIKRVTTKTYNSKYTHIKPVMFSHETTTIEKYRIPQSLVLDILKETVHNTHK